MKSIESNMPLPESSVWTLQDHFYEGTGPNAWKEDIVPEGTTSNAYLADVYAGIAAAYCRDLAKQGSGPPLILEVGGGSGRFAWLFLNRLMNHHLADDEEELAFNYLLTDAAESNVVNWQGKKRFRKLVDSGILDFGVLRVEESLRIETLASGVLTAKNLEDRPVILIANYLLGTIPCDLYRARDHKLFRELISLSVEDGESPDESIRSFANIKAEFSSEEAEAPYTGHAAIDAVLETYRDLPGDSCIPVPKPSIQFMENFLNRGAPFMLLAADLAYTRPEAFSKSDPFIFKSYFAYYTNFHMIGEIFRRHGGSVQFQRFEDSRFSVGAFMQPEAGKDLPETRRSARVNLRDLTPYDAYNVIWTFRHRVGVTSFREVSAWLCFSRFDPLTAEACLPLLFDAFQEDESELDRQQLYEMYMEAYRSYFPDGSEDTLDYGIAQLFLAAKLDREALELMEESIPEFGKTAERLYVYSLVLLRLERVEEAREVLAEALGLNPEFGPAQRLQLRRFGHGADVLDTNAGICVDSRTNDSLGRALEVFDESGAVQIDGLFPKSLIKDLYEAYMAGVSEQKSSSLGAPYQVGENRMMVPLRLQPPFDNPDVFANPFLLDFLKKLLGDDLIINSFGSVIAYPGAKTQHTHRDHPMLFDSDELDSQLPPYAVTVLIPLIDLNSETGSTQLWEGSHRVGRLKELTGQPTVSEPQAGSCLAFDYRIYHRGTPNLGESPRPVLYLVYSRPWFRDSKNFFNHFPLPITEDERAAFPEEHRPLLRFGNIV